MLQNITTKLKFASLLLVLVFLNLTSYSQLIKRTNPKWWFGVSGAAQQNYYRGTSQVLNADLTVPAAFHEGISIRPYASILTEYRPNKYFGIMLNVAFDNRGGKFYEVIAPCNCEANLTTNLSYAAIEPSIRLAPFKNSFYVFAGPTFGININKRFLYTQKNQPDLRQDWSSIHKNMMAAQFGLGFDILVSSKTSETQMTLSPFASFQTDIYEAPRSIETWSIYTVRAGIALKLGSSKRKPIVGQTKYILVPAAVAEKEVHFYVRAPKVVPLNRQVKETFPLRNSVFFDMGTTEIPSRYILLNKEQAKVFSEEKLQQGQPNNLYRGRSARQLEVYYNILNIVGDRMRTNEKSSIVLVGSSDNNPVEGQELAEHVKDYFVNNYNIEPSRIQTKGRDKPVIPSEQPGAVSNLDLLHEGDRRVDIESTSSELLMQVGGVISLYLKPVQISDIQQDPLDSHVIFTVEGANELLSSWNIDVTDEGGNVQHYGNFTTDQASIPGNTILGNKSQGNFTVLLIGKTKAGADVKKTSSVSLIKVQNPKQVGLRYSILFDFDKSESIASYENFLKDIVTPLIPNNGTVIIHGYTDIIGKEDYNLNLSRERVMSVQAIIKNALQKTKRKGVKFETYGFGEDLNMSPFENKTPEQRFYNRTVIIDIIPEN